ncbi:glycosyltransferase family 4 protein [Senegalia sp. (in: firmicutes)]|uniref:glycosyltransferase family 4 protein n=1 Tax=Senegalia sp. (in: firmicutes) TaxID=1924098 RepID=UPI003F960562
MIKKVLFVSTVESHIILFHIPFMKYFQDKGYEVHVATKISKRKQDLINENIILHDIDFTRKPYSYKIFKSLFQLIKLMKNNNFNLIHFHTPMASFIGRLAAKITNTNPVLYTAHGFHFYKNSPPLNWILFYNLERIASHWTDGLITINEEDYNRAKKFKLRKSGSLYYLNGVGVDIDKYEIKNNVSKEDIRKKLGFSKDDFIVLMIGELNKNKNHIQAINAIDSIKNKDIKLIIVGEGELQNNLENYIKDQNIENVKMLGFRKDIPEILFSSDVLVSMSHREGLPKNIIEGMVASKPIIATNIRGNRDLVKNNVNGYLVEVGDEKSTKKYILELYNDKKLRMNLGKQGRKFIDKYSLKNIMIEMDKIYKKYID